jgi:hypothetical protein
VFSPNEAEALALTGAANLDAAISKLGELTPVVAVKRGAFYRLFPEREYRGNPMGEVNSSMPDYVAGKSGPALNSTRQAFYGISVLVPGVAYKRNVDDMRESPPLQHGRTNNARCSPIAIPKCRCFRSYANILISIWRVRHRPRRRSPALTACCWQPVISGLNIPPSGSRTMNPFSARQPG